MGERRPDDSTWPDETEQVPGPPDATVVQPPRGAGQGPPPPPPHVASGGSGSGGSTTPWLALVALAVGIGALVVGIIALSTDDSGPAEAVAGGAIGADNIADGAVTNPKIAGGAVGQGKLADGSVSAAKIAEGAVGEAALADGSVSNSRIVERAVGPGKLADGAVGTAKIQDGAVTGTQVAPDSLGGAQIDESSLETVPSAENAAVAEVALALEGGGSGGGGAPSIEFVQASSNADPADVKGPVVAECPDGSQVLSGGAAIVGSGGAGVPVALVLSTPSGNGWAASARTYAETDAGWQIDVTATCATFGG